MKVYPNIKKARTNLKWQPKINFNTGLRLTIKSYKS